MHRSVFKVDSLLFICVFVKTSVDYFFFCVKTPSYFVFVLEILTTELETKLFSSGKVFIIYVCFGPAQVQLRYSNYDHATLRKEILASSLQQLGLGKRQRHVHWHSLKLSSANGT